MHPFLFPSISASQADSTVIEVMSGTYKSPDRKPLELGYSEPFQAPVEGPQ